MEYISDAKYFMGFLWTGESKAAAQDSYCENIDVGSQGLTVNLGIF